MVAMNDYSADVMRPTPCSRTEKMAWVMNRRKDTSSDEFEEWGHVHNSAFVERELEDETCEFESVE